MARYRYVIGHERGRWADTEQEALLDAVKAGHGSTDRFEPRPGDYSSPIYLHPFVQIEERPDDAADPLDQAAPKRAASRS